MLTAHLHIHGALLDADPVRFDSINAPIWLVFGLEIAEVLDCVPLLELLPLLGAFAHLGNAVQDSQVRDNFTYGDLIHYVMVGLRLQPLLPCLRCPAEAHAILARHVSLAGVPHRLDRVPLHVDVRRCGDDVAFVIDILVLAAVLEQMRHQELVRSVEVEGSDEDHTEGTQRAKQTTNVRKEIQKAVHSSIVVPQVVRHLKCNGVVDIVTVG